MHIGHWIIHWLSRQLITMEERQLCLEEARRLKIKTDLQEQRIKRRQAAAATYRLAATWRHRHRRKVGVTWADVNSMFYLEQSDYGRRIRGGPVVKREDGRVIADAVLCSFEQSQPIWATYIQPWLDGTIDTKQLKHPEIILPGT